ncbi:unnamed protein product [Rodentolepis nana]|uniref:DUF1552 domain-containing protein n=1 Tax=Rodentolepis nana TaxID=102285 RepID=A0A0R3T3A8_RODNA|nr:unnamed protein product [Rodentolepis nana]
MLNSNILELIYSNEDPATYLHYNGTRTTPDILLVSTGVSEHFPLGFKRHHDISEHTRRISSWLQATSASIHAALDDPGSGHKPVMLNITIGSLLVTNQCAKKTVTPVKTKHFRGFWSEYLEELKRKRDAIRNTADQTGRTEGVQAWRA